MFGGVCLLLVHASVWKSMKSQKHFTEFLQKPSRIFSSSSRCPSFSGKKSTSALFFNPKSLVSYWQQVWMNPKQCSVLQELSRPFVPATPIKGFPSPANAPTLARKRGPFFPPCLHCFLLRLVRPRGIKSMQVLFWGLGLRFSGFSCDLVSPCTAQEPALDPQAAARNAWSAGASESGLHLETSHLCWGLRNNGILARRADTG